MARVHDSRGRLISLWKIPNGIVAFGQAARRRLFDIYPELPWIPFEAIDKLDRIIDDAWNVFEIGSGMSTVWLAKRANHVTSIEASEEWYKKLSQLIVTNKINNVDLKLLWRSNEISDFNHIPNKSIDLLYIDGGPRDVCLINGFEKVKVGGFVYMDNWDVDGYWALARPWSDANTNRFIVVNDFVDYAPAHFGVTEGRLIRRVA